MIIEIKNTFDSDGSILYTIYNNQTIPSELIENLKVIEFTKNVLFTLKINIFIIASV